MWAVFVPRFQPTPHGLDISHASESMKSLLAECNRDKAFLSGTSVFLPIVGNIVPKITVAVVISVLDGSRLRC
jgi:hypothetical protein